MKVLQKNKIANHSFFSRNVLRKFFLTAFASTVLVAGMFFTPVLTVQACDKVCPDGGGWEKVDNLKGFEYTYTAPSGKVITETCYKHATFVHYAVITPAASATVVADWHDGIQHELSHASFKLEDASVPEGPICPFVPQAGRTIVEFGDRIRSDKTESEATAGPYSTNIPAGTYDIWFSSYDYHTGHPTQVQPKEMWYAILKSGSTTISSTNAISDLPDGFGNDYITEKVEAEYVISEDVSVIVIRHWAYPNSNPNSITPVCAAFDWIDTAVYGCTDPNAKNYNEDATNDDDSCEYYQCSDGIDNDGDGFIDYPEDSGCDSPEDDDENSPPVITLTATTTTITVGDDFDPIPFATANDVEDGDITSDIVASSTVSTSTPGTYYVDYNVEDSEGEPAETKTLEVIVVDEEDETILGCTDPVANNYNSSATEDDGSCTYGGPAPIPGCTDPIAVNYNSGATWNDGSCTYGGPAPIPGCTDPVATNYNSGATWNDSSCTYGGPSPVYQCSDGIDNDGDGLIDSDDPGCHTDGDPENPNSYDPTDDDETNPTPPAQCNYLLEYLKLGEDNNPVEVLKLQVFLKNLEGFEGLGITGFFDQTTFDAVSEFQTKYEEDVLTPWGHDGPTGYVYITTKKKVNEIYCQRPFPLTSGQETEIDEFRAFLESLAEEQQLTPEEIETQFPEIFEEIGMAPSSQTPGEEEENAASLIAGVNLADIQMLAELEQQKESEKAVSNNREKLLAALNFVADNKLVAVLVALAVFFFFSLLMIWKKTKPENPTYF